MDGSLVKGGDISVDRVWVHVVNGCVFARSNKYTF